MTFRVWGFGVRVERYGFGRVLLVTEGAWGQIKDNQCATCTALPNGGVRLENEKGLRFNGASYDDNEIGKGSYQAMNICMLAKYGNGGTITKPATPDCAGFSNYNGANNQVHW